jgi:hypothetical protein
MKITHLCVLLAIYGIESVDRHVRPYGYSAVPWDNNIGFQLIKL